MRQNGALSESVVRLLRAIEVFVADLSADGVLLYSRGTPFPIGSEISGWLDAPALGDLDEEFVAIWMTVAWRVVEPRGWFKCGCSFAANDPATRARIEHLISVLKAPERGVIHAAIPE